MTTARYIPLANIRRRTDARAIDRENVEGIKASIREVGLLSPVIVRHADSNTFELIAGNHRFVAVQELGEPDILALDLADLDDLKAELAMIDENLRRSDPSPAERSAQIARRKAIYEQLHPETKNGAIGNGREKLRQVGEATSSNENSTVDRFTAETSAATGRSERAVQRDAERGEKVAPKVLEMVRGTKLDTGAYLDKIKNLMPREQVFAAKRDLAFARSQERGTTNRKGGLAARYAAAPEPVELTPTESYERFLKVADAMEKLDVAKIVEGAGKQRSVLGQRASGLADQMGEIMEGLSR